LAESIDVLYDVSQGGPQGGPRDRGDRGRGEDLRGELRGIIRAIDTDAQTLEISDSSRGGTVTVSYDDHTPVRFQGQLYTPDNLETGDEVRIRAHDYDGRLFAQEIVVVRDRRSRG
jgi:hypothetical protein